MPELIPFNMQSLINGCKNIKKMSRHIHNSAFIIFVCLPREMNKFSQDERHYEDSHHTRRQAAVHQSGSSFPSIVAKQ